MPVLAVHKDELVSPTLVLVLINLIINLEYTQIMGLALPHSKEVRFVPDSTFHTSGETRRGLPP